jgi:predicted nucleotidyltransferase
MKLLLENWRLFTENNNLSISDEVQIKADIVFRIADGFLDELDAPQITAIYLVGSRADNTQHKDSDWDFLVFGDGFDEVEDEKNNRADEGNPFPGLDIDVAAADRHISIDIIFSSSPPSPEQASIKVYPR